MEQKWQILQDLPGHLMGPLSDLKSHGFDTLLQSLFGDLKVAGACLPGCMLSLALGGKGMGGRNGRSMGVCRPRDQGPGGFLTDRQLRPATSAWTWPQRGPQAATHREALVPPSHPRLSPVVRPFLLRRPQTLLPVPCPHASRPAGRSEPLAAPPPLLWPRSPRKPLGSLGRG